MDRIEQTIRRNDEKLCTKDRFKYHIFMALAIAFLLIAIVYLVSLFSALAALNMDVIISNVIFLALSVACAVVCYVVKDEMLLEYDYIIEDDCFIIAKIKNLKARKEIVNVPVKDIKRVYAYNKDDFEKLEAKKIKSTLNADAERYVLICEHDERLAIVFEPNEEMLTLLKKELNK